MIEAVAGTGERQDRAAPSAGLTDRQEVKGLDTLRFVAALTVALSHGAGPPLALWLDKSATWSRLFIGAYDVSFDGVAAVMVFFVVSGFCIHFGPASGAPFRVLPFWTRRGISHRRSR